MYSGNYKQFDSESVHQEIIMKRGAGVKPYWTFYIMLGTFPSI